MKRFFALCLFAFATMHFSAVAIFLIRFQTLKPQSLVLGTIFLALGIWLYKNSKNTKNKGVSS